MSLTKERREYYRYGASGWTYKQPPVLAPEVVNEMKRLGLDRNYRFVWAGVAVIRDEPNSTAPEVRGDRAATWIVNGRLEPKWLHVKARQPKYLCYRDERGHVCRTTRPELIPPGRLTWWEFHYVEYGKLLWMVEYRADPEVLIATNAAHKDEVEIDGWTWIQTLETAETDEHAEGLYYEPDVTNVHMLAEREFENRNANLKEVAKRDSKFRAARRAEKDEKINDRAWKEFNEMWDETEQRELARRAYKFAG